MFSFVLYGESYGYDSGSGGNASIKIIKKKNCYQSGAIIVFCFCFFLKKKKKIFFKILKTPGDLLVFYGFWWNYNAATTSWADSVGFIVGSASGNEWVGWHVRKLTFDNRNSNIEEEQR